MNSSNMLRSRLYQPPPPVAAAQAASSATETLIDQLEKLGDLKDRGLLTDAEFASQKARLLAE